MDEILKKARKEGKALSPIMRIGKNGISDAVVKEIAKLLKKKRLIKVKLLQSFTGDHDRKQAGQVIAEKTDSVVVEQVGGVVVLLRKRQETEP